MIVKDEEENLSKCLNSVSGLFDEIIIVDTGSIDNTKNIAKKYTNKIYDFKWIDDFSAARNFAFSKATKDYIMWLDADDIILPSDLKKLKKLKNTLSKNIDIVMLKYNIAFDDNGNPTFSYFRERIFKRKNKYKWQDRIHEFIMPTGNVISENIAVTHDKKITEQSSRNLNIYKDMEKNKEHFTPRNLYYYGRELYDHKMYQDSIDVLKRFLNTKEGWIEDNINSCYLISNCYYFLKNNERALEYLFKTFEFDLPRRKTVCLIGNYFVNNEEIDKAIYWYETALTLPINKNGFYESNYDYFIPYLNLSVCYYKKGDYVKSKHYHNLSKKIKPNDNLVSKNEKYFQK